jgi:hypothetical protein
MIEEQHPIGYIYRIPQSDATYLQSLITTWVGAGWTFGGAAQWDFDSHAGRGNLRAIKAITATDLIDVKGDFGHAFSASAEVRWKRRDDGGYDVLVLSEKQRAIEGSQPLRMRDDRDWQIRRHPNDAIVRADNQPAISYIDYLAPNGAVQFQRLVEVL